ncbi:MAG TPA: S24 family peptidase, partial [Vicinamibacterales bacterium]|nr:S24 family peptidase [Vicinamibacterales bacterium]
LATGLANLDDIDDSTLEGVRRKEARYAEIVRSTGYAHGRLWADAWCAAFVWPKTREAHPLTEDLFRTIERNPMAAPEAVRREVQRIAEEYRFFHWHLAFPDVFRVPGADQPLAEGPGWIGGFDVVLGNPPWERIKIQEKEWFAERRPDIAGAPNAAGRKRLIRKLSEDDPALSQAWLEALRRSDGESTLVRSSGRYPLCGRGDINTYAVFAELNLSLLGPRARAGFIVPTGIATDDTTKLFLQDIMNRRALVSLYDFQSGPGLFSEIGHARFKFSLLTLAGRQSTRHRGAEFAFFLRSVGELDDPQRRFVLTSADIALLNPNTRTCPIFRTRRDADLTKAIYRRVPVLINESQGEAGNPWGIKFLRMFDMATDSPLFRTREQLEADGWTLRGNIFERASERYLPLYEAKMVHHFNHRFGDYADKDPGDEGTALPSIPESRLLNPDYVVIPKYWVSESEVTGRLNERWRSAWLLGWRDITNAGNERTVIASVIPRVGVGHKLPLVLSVQPGSRVTALIANLSSFVFDYCARQKLGGTSLTYFIVKQLPVVPPQTHDFSAPWSTGECLIDWIRQRVLELTFTANDIGLFARDLGWNGPPFRWDSKRRFLLRCELDAAFFHLYGVQRDDVDYIMDTFPIVRRNDEAAYGEYRTKRVILELYDQMQRAIDTGVPYQTVLDPPPADPRVAHDAVTVPARAVAVATTPAASKLIALEEERVLRRVIAKRADRYRTCVPLIDLKIAAGSFGDDQEPEFDSWVEIKASRPLQRGMFVAQVTGRSMEPLIPDGAFCLFQRKAPALRDGMIAAVQLHGLEDPEHGGRYTVKKLAVTTERDPATGEMRRRTVLEPLNPECRPIEVSDESGDIRLVAEFVEVLAELEPTEAVEG